VRALLPPPPPDTSPPLTRSRRPLADGSLPGVGTQTGVTKAVSTGKTTRCGAPGPAAAAAAAAAGWDGTLTAAAARCRYVGGLRGGPKTALKVTELTLEPSVHEATNRPLAAAAAAAAKRK
jgi:hypothetical protein